MEDLNCSNDWNSFIKNIETIFQVFKAFDSTLSSSSQRLQDPCKAPVISSQHLVKSISDWNRCRSLTYNRPNFRILQGKKEGKDQESIQPSSTPDPGYHRYIALLHSLIARRCEASDSMTVLREALIGWLVSDACHWLGPPWLNLRLSKWESWAIFFVSS